jgi:hypothetical protein
MRSVIVFLIAFLGLSAATAQNGPTGIDWEVRHRFRVVQDHRHDQFIADFNSYFQRAAAARGLDIPSGKLSPYPSPFQTDLPTHYRPDTAQYDHGWFHATERAIAVRLTKAADRGKNCVWRIGERETAPSRCGRLVPIATSLGPQELSVRIDAGDGRPPEERRLAIEIKDLKIVALGDSFGSGEGNPHVTFERGVEGNASFPLRMAEWWDHRCHRSLIAASAQTAIMLAQARRDTSVTYVSFACSGGTIREGLIGGYDGVETAKQAGDRLRLQGGAGNSIPHYRRDPLPVQIERAEALLCLNAGERPCLSRRQPDAVVVTTGGNELDFGPKVRNCALRRCRFTEAQMAPAFAALRADFAALHPRLSALQARHVFLMTYPNMVRQEDGRRYCGDRPFDGRPEFVSPLAAFMSFGIARAESRSAERFVLDPLNALIVGEAAQRGWHAVQGFTLKRGYCARPSWFHTVSQASAKQGEIGEEGPDGKFASLYPSGAMHPNVFGHAGMRAELLRAIERVLPP